MYSISLVNNYRTCPYLFYHYYQKHITKRIFNNLNYDLTALFLNKLDLLDNPNLIIKKSFKKPLIKYYVDALLPLEDNTYALYYFVSTTYVSNKHYKLVADLKALLLVEGIEVSEVYVGYLNKDYVRGKELNLDKLCIIEKLSQKRLNKITSYINIELVEMDYFNQRLENQYTNSTYQNKCHKCPAYNVCVSKLVDNDIRHFINFKDKAKLYDQGIRLISELEPSMIKGPLQYAQYYAAMHQEFIDKYALSSWLNALTYPLSFLDFEWDTYVIPTKPGMKVNDTLCFQYSLHTLNAEFQLVNHDFIDEDADEVKFIKDLLANIAPTGNIVVFNAKGGELLRILQLAKRYPKYAKQLEALSERIVDLNLLFENGAIYHPKMNGKFSLKSITSAYTNLAYSELAIKDGVDATLLYRNLKNLKDNDKLEAIEKLKSYCSLDTYSLYAIYLVLLQKLK